LHFLGDDWFVKHIQSNNKINRKGFLIPKDQTIKDSIVANNRIIALAEYLYNFYEISGFSKYLSAFKSRTDIEASFAELEVALLLKTNGVPFRFIEPTNARGFDYDLEIIMPDGTIAPCETKCKLEAKDITENSIFNSLNDLLKRKQLPRDNRNIVFVSIPSLWVTGDALLTNTDWDLSDYNARVKEVKEKIKKATDRIFARTSNILEIIFFSKVMMDIPNKPSGNTVTAHYYLIMGGFINQRSAFAIQHRSLVTYIDEEQNTANIKQELRLEPRLPINKRKWITMKSLID
jgi:hypothetical protein